MRHRKRRHRIRNRLPKRMRELQKAEGKIGLQKGHDAEELVRQALAALYVAGCIKNFGVSVPMSFLDLHQVDAWFNDLLGEWVGFQVKASDLQARHHAQKYPGVPCVSAQGHTLQTMTDLLWLKFRLPRPQNDEQAPT